MWLDGKLITLKYASGFRTNRNQPTEWKGHKRSNGKSHWGSFKNLWFCYLLMTLRIIFRFNENYILAILTISMKTPIWVNGEFGDGFLCICESIAQETRRVSDRRRKLWVISFQMVLETTGVFKTFLGERCLLWEVDWNKESMEGTNWVWLIILYLKILGPC